MIGGISVLGVIVVAVVAYYLWKPDKETTELPDGSRVRLPTGPAPTQAKRPEPRPGIEVVYRPKKDE